MSDQKIDYFLALLRSRTIDKIRVTDIMYSCTASLLLIFAAIDCMSKITCNKEEYEVYVKHETGAGARFKGFLKKVMGGNYAKDAVCSQLYKLRCDIVHTGIGRGVTLSRHDDALKHLQEVDGDFWVHTPTLLSDLEAAIEQISADFDAKGAYYKNALARLVDFAEVVDLDDARPSEAPDEVFQ